jgi:SAM-dependent methyltransferase
LVDETEAIRRGKTDTHHSPDLLANEEFQTGYQTRFDVLLDHFNVTDWSKISLMDIGCGQGGFGLKFKDIGADVTFIDGREKNLEVVRQRAADAKTILYNVESGEKVPVAQVDFILFMGLLYHVGNPAEAIKLISQTSSNICFETACLDHDGSAAIYFQEDNSPTSFSVTGNACRTSPKWVEEALIVNGYSLIEDISNTSFNVPTGEGYSGLVYDWEYERTCGWRRNECSLRRIWIASKSKETTIFNTFKS